MNPIYAPLLWKEGIPLPFSRKVWAACRYLDQTVTRIAEEKFAKVAEESIEEGDNTFRGDLLDMLIRSHQLSPEELHNNIFTFLAGTFKFDWLRLLVYLFVQLDRILRASQCLGSCTCSELIPPNKKKCEKR